MSRAKARVWPTNGLSDTSHRGTQNSRWPRISIVTPSYNQGDYLDEAIASVLNQRYPNLEYNVIDGGSDDGTVDVIRRHSSRLNYWVSEDDGGQFEAINKGFARCTGDIMAWLNADDMLWPWALKQVASIFEACPEVSWLTTSFPITWERSGIITHMTPTDGYAAKWFYWGHHLGNSGNHKGWIQQESTFWRRSLWDAAGGYVDSELNFAADFELWARFWQHAELYSVAAPIGGFRVHYGQKTANMDAYYAEANAVLKSGGTTHRPPLAFLPLARLFQKVTKKGGRFFGGKVHTVRYDFAAETWRTGWQYVI